MTASKTVYKRLQPLMGTVVEVFVSGGFSRPQVRRAVSRSFKEARRLEGVFVGARAKDENFRKARALAFELKKASNGAFDPTAGGVLDLKGVAKGLIVDRMSEILMRKLPQCSGAVNAGGDLRFFGDAEKQVSIHLGARRGKMRNILTAAEAVATSSPALARKDKNSSTRYRGRPRTNGTVVSLAKTCAVADGFAKVVLFGSKAAIRFCANKFGAEALVFGPSGKLLETWV